MLEQRMELPCEPMCMANIRAENGAMAMSVEWLRG